MPQVNDQDFMIIWQARGMNILSYLLKKWYFLVLAVIAGGVIGYMKARKVKPVYTADISFVLSTDQKDRNNFAGLASQLGFDGISSSPDNIFAGDNIIELFKSRKLIRAALLSVADSASNQTLINYIAQHQYGDLYKKMGPFNQKPGTYSLGQKKLLRKISLEASKSFKVFKKDKKLVFYLISTSSIDPKIAVSLSRLMLDQTSRYFIETKTKVAVSSVALLQHEADSIASVLSNIYSSTAAMNDRTYNLNPSITVQRAGSQFNQARVAAFAAAYTEVMRNLEIAKINLQKETPLYRIIDEPELPLLPVRVSTLKYSMLGSIAGFFLMALVLAGMNLYKPSIKI
jgi:uncharacterized protein involved in exopolysaccharide biosynthesis